MTVTKGNYLTEKIINVDISSKGKIHVYSLYK